MAEKGEVITTEADKKIGLLQNKDGELSSGRLIKIISAVTAVAFGAVGMVIIAKNPSNIILADYCLKQTAIFLGVATGTELVQKITGR